jgi:hypothetical protein
MYSSLPRLGGGAERAGCYRGVCAGGWVLGMAQVIFAIYLIAA